jgi:hypothetical protein
MGTIEELIEIYARHQADDVASDPHYVYLCQANDTDNVFHATRRRVEMIKRTLEKRVGNQKTYQKQVKYALILFHRLVGSEDQQDEICLRIVRQSYYPKWTDKQKAYFDETSALLKTSLDYFLSFTQRNQTGAGNPINGAHRYLIQSMGLLDPVSSVQNELAHMLDIFLSNSRYQFRGFYFPTHEDNSQQVDQKVYDSLDNSLVFIQLVQNAMFSRLYNGRPNYCFREYQRAVAQRKNMIFLFADGQHPNDLIPEEDVEFDLDAWHTFVIGVDCLDLQPTRIAEQSSSIQVNITRLKERLVEGVRRFREALWEGVPGDLD